MCHNPRCFTKWKADTLDGKVAQCPQCGKDFIVSISLIPEDAMFITCENCSPAKSYSPATIQEIQERLDKVAKETYKTVYLEKLGELNAREQELFNKERKLREKEGEFAAKLKTLKEYEDKLAKTLLHIKHRRESLEKRFLQCKQIIALKKTKTKPEMIPQEGLSDAIGKLLEKELTK